MGRPLTDNERNRINQLCGSRFTLAVSFGNVGKIIGPILAISICLYLYFDISVGSIWTYLGIGIIISIIEIVEITKLQSPYLAILNNNSSCFESKMLSHRPVLITDPQNLISYSVLEKTVRPGEVRHYTYYVTVNIEGKVQEIEYLGKEFDYLTIGEEMFIIQFKNRKKAINYVCFSKKEINTQP